MSKLGYSAVLSTDSITVTIDGEAFTVEESAENFRPLWEAIGQRADVETVRKLVSVKKAIEMLVEGAFTFSETGEVLYRGKPAPDHAVRTLLKALEEDQDVRPLCRFFEKAFANPQEGMVHELFDYFQHQGIKITPDGDILALKIVKENYFDHHTGRVAYKLGTVVEMPRGACDTNRGRDCSSGLHFCGPGYVNGFGGSDSRVVFVKINPADVTSIPNYAGFSKARCCRMHVIGECEERRGNGGVATWQKNLDAYLTTLYAGVVDTTPSPVKPMPKKTEPVKSKLVITVTNEEPVLVHGKHRLAISFIRETVARLGQRGFMREYGVPRSTLQGFMKKHAAYVAAPPPTKIDLAKVERPKPKTSVPSVPRREPVAAPPEPAAKPARQPAPPVKPTQGAGLAQPDTTRKLSSAEKAMAKKAAEEAAPEKAKTKQPALVGGGFSHAGKSYSAVFITKEVAKRGQRGFSTEHNVPRSTLQGWLKQIGEAPAPASAPEPKPAPAATKKAPPAPTPQKKPAEAPKALPDKLPKPRAAKATPKAPEKTFTSRGATFTASYIKERVAAVGQRGAAREMDVPRTTIQLWLKEIG